MAEKNMEMTAFELVASAGESRSLAMEAIKIAREGDIAAARAKLDEAHKAFEGARDTQHEIVELLFNDEDKIELDPLFVHAQDQLMTTMMAHDLAEELIYVYERLNG